MLANQRCSRTALGGVSLDKPFDLIEGHPGKEPKGARLVEAIAEAARELVAKRDSWLNPPDASADELKKRTLTNLYNARPAWLADAHRKLDEAVFAAYGWPATLSDGEVLERLLALNHQRAAAQNVVQTFAEESPKRS